MRALETAFLRWVDAPPSDREARARAAAWCLAVAFLKGKVADVLALHDGVGTAQRRLVTSFGGAIEGWVLVACLVAERLARTEPLVRASVESGWRGALERLGVAAGEAALVAKLVAVGGALMTYETVPLGVEALAEDPSLQTLLGVHEALGTVWMRAEPLDALLAWLEEAVETLAFARTHMASLPHTAASMPPPPPDGTVSAPVRIQGAATPSESPAADGDAPLPEAVAPERRARTSMQSTQDGLGEPATRPDVALRAPEESHEGSRGWRPELPYLTLEAAHLRAAAKRNSYRFDRPFLLPEADEVTDDR